MPRARLTRIAGTFAVVSLLWGAVRAQAPAPRPATPAPEYSFSTGAGALFFYVRPERTGDFEAIVTRLGQVLDASTDPARRQQAANWRVYKSIEASRDAAVYVFLFDPAITTADYDPVKVLGESAPTEAQALFDRMKAAVIKVERMGLGKLR